MKSGGVIVKLVGFVGLLALFLPLAASASEGAVGPNPHSTSTKTLIAQAKQAIAQYSPKPTFVAPGPAINVKSLHGKTVLIVVNDETSDALVQMVQGVQQAGAAAGVTVKLFNGNDQTTNDEQGIQEGINERVAAIITVGITSDTITGTLAAAKRAGIPVVASTGQVPVSGVTGQGAGPDAFAMSGYNAPEEGKLMAGTAIVHTNGDVKAALLGFNNGVSESEMSAVQSLFSQCATCKVLKTDLVEPADWPTTLPGLTEAFVREFPDMNTIITSSDTMAIFIADGLKVAKADGKVFVYTTDGTNGAPLALTQAGSVVLTDTGGLNTWVGWNALDQAMRGMLKMSPGNPFVPIRYLSAANLKGVNTSSATAVYGNGYIKGFEKLWGVAKG